MIRIGIPRALLYYQYYPMWKTFFEELECGVVLSPPTTQAMLADGSARVVAETCLPVKVFLGHVLYLVDKCDFLFIPAIRSVKAKVYNCSKFLGLPDMSRAVIPEAPPILDTDIDINKGKDKLYQAIYELGRRFTRKQSRVEQAIQAAWRVHLNYQQLMYSHGLTPPQAIEKMFDNTEIKPEDRQSRAPIALIGHPYLLYDEYINHRIMQRLQQLGYEVLTPEMLTSEKLEFGIASLVHEAYWTYEEEVTGAGGYYLQNNTDGVIGILAFGCGPDSLMMDMVHRQAAKLSNIPFMSLTIDEHTAEAGVVTRLEAFTDMLSRKKKGKVCV